MQGSEQNSGSDGSGISVTDLGASRLVVIDRPRKANAIHREMLDELLQIVDETGRDDRIRLFALMGAGAKIFSAGADLRDAADEYRDSPSAMRYDARWRELADRIAGLGCISVALINGACIGGGLTLALAFDLRVAAGHAWIEYPAIRHGFLPDPVDVERVRQLAGPSLARRLFLLGETIHAPAALTAGLVDEIVEKITLTEALQALQERILAGKFLSQLAVKRLIASEGEAQGMVEAAYRAVYDNDPEAIALLRGSAGKSAI